jgi:hypothetical protein
LVQALASQAAATQQDVALARAAGLALLDTLDVAGGVLAGHHRLHAVRAHLYEMAGDVDSALHGCEAGCHDGFSKRTAYWRSSWSP